MTDQIFQNVVSLPEITTISSSIVDVELLNFKNSSTTEVYSTEFEITLNTLYPELFEYDNATKSIKTKETFDYETMSEELEVKVTACSIGLPQQM